MRNNLFTLLAALVMTAAAAVHFDGAKYALFVLTIAAAVLYMKEQKGAAEPTKKQDPPRRWSVRTVLDPKTSAPRYILHSGLDALKLDRAALVAWLNDHPKDGITGTPQDMAMIERIRRM